MSNFIKKIINRFSKPKEPQQLFSERLLQIKEIDRENYERLAKKYLDLAESIQLLKHKLYETKRDYFEKCDFHLKRLESRIEKLELLNNNQECK